MGKLKIKNIDINEKSRPKIIAEISGNHNGSLKKAIQMVKVAKKVGADFVKLQTYTADTITLNSKKAGFQIKNKKSLWNGKSLYELYKKAHTPWEWHEKLFSVAKKSNIVMFSTPFDETSVDFLEDLKVPAYKISSFENNHYPLIKKILKTKKPIIVSTGVTSRKKLDALVELIKEYKNQFVILQCNSSYPTNPKDINLLNIPEFKKRYKCLVGLSDHSKGIGAAIASVALGSVLIEKHFNISFKKKGVDSKFSLLENDFSSLVKETKIAWQSLGVKKIGITKSEKNSIQFKRSIYASSIIKKGEKITKENIKVVRPGYGMDPKYFYKIQGKIAKKNILYATPIAFKDLK